MKKEIICKECGHRFGNYRCDTCGENIFIPSLFLIIDLEEYNFCNYQCLLQFIMNELKKGERK